jgi:hypothetical protein
VANDGAPSYIQAAPWPSPPRCSPRPAGPGGGYAPLAFSYINRVCMVVLYGRAGRFNAKNAGFRPLVPPPVWSTAYLLLQKVTIPRFTILNAGFGPGQDPPRRRHLPGPRIGLAS